MKNNIIESKLIELTLIFVVLISAFCSIGPNEKDYTDLVKKLKADISDPKSMFYHKAYERLAYISDTYGPRLWGSNALELVIKEIYTMAQKQGFDNVRLEPVTNFTKWVRVSEKLTLYSPRPSPTDLKVIGLGGTVSGNIRANAIVVSSYDELDARKNQVKGKIVVYNQPWINYLTSVQYRSNGASRAAKYGAVAALIRSVTPQSIQSVHTGMLAYQQKYKKVPAAAITVEDAQMFARMQARNQTIQLQLKLENLRVSGCNSSNVIFEIQGWEKPDQILLMGGHIDSWDTGSQTGANDDGGGFITVFQAMRLLLKNGFRPRRTLRFIAWSGQEWGDPKNGAHVYLNNHQNQLNKHIVAFEDDLGSTKLYGFGFSGKAQGKSIVKDICDKYLSIIGVNALIDDGQSSDTAPLRQRGIPTMVNLIQDTQDHLFFFKYHHSGGDSMNIMNPVQLDSNVLGVASLFYILADLQKTIPKQNKYIHRLKFI